ncbi:MAG TPA: hypothetical protein VF334_04650 [Polyangia bacterium]
MRPLVLTLALLTTSLAAAEELAPAPTAPPAVLAPRAPMLLTPPDGWRYQIVDGAPIKERYNGLIAGGAVMLSVGWVANLQAGIPTGQWMLDIPLFGPLMEIANIGGGSDPFLGWVDFLLVTDSLVQIGGLAMLIAGGTTYKNKPGVQRIELVPCGAGAAIRGSF